MNYETNLLFSELFSKLEQLENKLSAVLSIRLEQDLWDNSELMRNWKISERTLADWRKKGIISYTKVRGKIWYTKCSRDSFINLNSNQVTITGIKCERRVRS
jgi:hypothetical protein